jgi:hypothetical protein
MLVAAELYRSGIASKLLISKTAEGPNGTPAVPPLAAYLTEK